MTATDTPFYRAFAARVRQQLDPASTTPEGSPTMESTATAETIEGATDQLATLLAEHGVQMIEGNLGEGVNGWAARVYGRITLVFPQGQDPQVRLSVARHEIARLESSTPSRLASTPCDNAWCTESGAHTWCYGREVTLADGTLHGYLLHDRRAGETFLNFGLTENSETRFRTGDEVRAQTAKVRAHLVRIDAMADQLDAIHEDGATPIPAAEPARRWTIATERGVEVSGHLPPWADRDPSDTVPADRLELRLSDLTHVQYFDGQTVNVDSSQGPGEDRHVGPCPMLNGGIWCHPRSDDPAKREPLVNLEVLKGGDDWIHGLDPDGVADLASKLRAQADRLDNDVRPMLIAARADWAANGGTH